MDKISELNDSRLTISNNRLVKCSRSEHKTYSPKQIKLPFFNSKHDQEREIEHSNIETPFIASKRNQIHRTHSKHRWQHPIDENHRQHYNHHYYHEQYSEHTKSSQMHFSKKFSFTQHCNHISRFYMIFVIFLIYLLDKINCDQGKWFSFVKCQSWIIHAMKALLLQNILFLLCES